MNFELIRKSAKQPVPFEKGDSQMWDDPHISKHMLDAHLNASWDAASRRPETIGRTVDWIQRFLKPGVRILDLGCGPGLYAERLAEAGYEVVGVDFSKRSIDYATQQAEKKDLDIAYHYMNYMELDFEDEFDLVMLIYCDFGVLDNAERDELIRRVKRAMKPGGTFVLDVFNETFVSKKHVGKDWSVQASGFWADEPHIVFEETFHFSEDSAFVDQYVVIMGSGQIRLYRNWDRYYSDASLLELMTANGFKCQVHHGVISDPAVTFLSARL